MSNHEHPGNDQPNPNASIWDNIEMFDDMSSSPEPKQVAEFLPEPEAPPEQEAKERPELTADALFNAFMDSLPENVDPATYANSPEGYLGFMSFISETDHTDEEEKKLVDIMFEYSSDFIDRGGILPSDADDFFFNIGQDEEMQPFYERHADIVQRMREQRLERIPQEIGPKIADLQERIKTINDAEKGWDDREYIPSGELTSYMRMLETIAKDTDRIDLTPLYDGVREKIVPELLPQYNDTQNSDQNFHLLRQLAKNYPQTIEGIDAPAVEAAKFAATRSDELNYDDYVPGYIQSFIYNKDHAGERAFNNEGKFSQELQDSVFYGLNGYYYSNDNDYNVKQRNAIAEIIGPERDAAIAFAAECADSPFTTGIPILAELITTADDSEAAMQTIKELAESGEADSRRPIALAFAMRERRINPNISAEDAITNAKTALRDCRELIPYIGSDGDSLSKIEDIGLISDCYPTEMQRNKWQAERTYINSFKSRLEAGEHFTPEEAQALTENMYRINTAVHMDGLNRDLAVQLQTSLFEHGEFLKSYGEEEKQHYDQNLAIIAGIKPNEQLTEYNVTNLQKMLLKKGPFESDLASEAAQSNLSHAIENCGHLNSTNVRDVLLKFIVEDEHFDDKTISPESIDGITDIITQIQNSNSLELRRLTEPLTRELIASSDRQETETEISYDTASAEKKLDSIESVFLQNNLPTLAKNLLVFNVLHPVDQFRQQFIEGSEHRVSPMLQRTSEHNPSHAYAIMLRDLVKTSIESNSLELRQYLQGLQVGQSIMDRIGSGEVDFDSLSSDEQEQVRTFVNNLAAGHNQTVAGRKEVATMEAQGGVHGEEDIPEGADWLYHDMPITPDTVARINRAMGATSRHNAADRLVRQFAYYNGYESVADMLADMDQTRTAADARNRAAATETFAVHTGDLVKSASGKYLDDMLEHGTNCKEFLGASADSDGTPLDTDLTLVGAEADIAHCTEIQTNPNGNYGYVWYIIRNNSERFVTTRKDEGQPGGELETPGLRDGRMELFKTGVMGDSHYGIRTGIGSTNIDAIVIDTQQEFPDKTAFRIVKNGFYIPVYDLQGKLIFTPDDYDALRAKLSGNHEYQTGEYHKANAEDFAADIERTQGIDVDVEQNAHEVARKDAAVRQALAAKLEGTGLRFRDHIDDDLTPGFIEISNTGSTGRGTNVPGDGDFDYIFRVDQSIIADPGRFATLSGQLHSAIIMDRNSESRPGQRAEDIRTKHVHVNGMEDEVDIDITFVPRTDKVTYATEDAIKDYLSNFEGEERAQVVKNIIAAKKLFKRHECYKPRHAGGTDEETGEKLAQGGLGGVGVENWILQNGGSLTAAARSFLEAAGVYGQPDATPVSLATFTKRYPIWDLGANHMAEEKGRYPHDNFTTNNLDESGYQKIIVALQEFLGES